MRTLLVSATVLLLTACEGNNQTLPDAGPTGPVPEDYFGLQLGRCFEYTTADQAQPDPDLGVVVESIDSAQFAVPTRVVAYTVSGMVRMRDYVAFDGESVVLYKRAFSGGKSYLYDPPMKRLTKPVKLDKRQEAKAKVTIYDGAGKPIVQGEEHALRVDVVEKALHLPIGKDVTGALLAFTETPSVGRTEYRVFLAGDGTRTAADGFVVLEYNFELDESLANQTYRLQKVRDLGDSPTTATPRCGMAPQ